MLDQRACRIVRFRFRMNTRGENGDLLDLRRQRSDHLDSRHGQELAHLLETDLGLAARDDRASRLALHLFHFRFDRIGDAHAPEKFREIGPARSGGIDDRRADSTARLSAPPRADIRLRRTRANRDADTGTREIEALADDACVEELGDRGFR